MNPQISSVDFNAILNLTERAEIDGFYSRIHLYMKTHILHVKNASPIESIDFNVILNLIESAEINGF